MAVLQCREDTICGLSISSELQDMLTAQPDLCDILSECKVRLLLQSYDS